MGEPLPSSLQLKLFNLISNNSPILLDIEKVDWGLKSFRFNNSWLEDGKFKQLVETWWSSFKVEGWVGFVLGSKLKLLKLKSKEWLKDNGGSVQEHKEAALRELEEWDAIEDIQDLEEEESTKRRLCRSRLWKCVRREEVEWRQILRCLRLKEGDKNTSFSHRMENFKQKVNSINSSVVNGRRIIDKDDIR